MSSGSERPFTIAVASGKGGTGKTLVATGLAAVEAAHGSRVALVDCDVEAPNDHLFFDVTVEGTDPVSTVLAGVDASACTACGRCRGVCAYGAIRILGDSAMVFPELCHGCGVCVSVCPFGAISEHAARMGEVDIGRASRGDDTLWVITGRLDVGQVKSPEVIRAARSRALALGADTVVLDAPPGVACSAVASLRGADALLLVTEPTPFGLHDLDLSLRLARDLGIPHAVIVNREGAGLADADAWCEERGVPIAMRIPFDRRIAETYARGELVTDGFEDLARELAAVARGLKRGGLAHVRAPRETPSVSEAGL